MECPALDVLGPLPVSNEGNKHLLIAMDYFTKRPKAYPLLNQEGTTGADILVREFFSRFGVPITRNKENKNNTPSSPVRWDG